MKACIPNGLSGMPSTEKHHHTFACADIVDEAEHLHHVSHAAQWQASAQAVDAGQPLRLTSSLFSRLSACAVVWGRAEASGLQRRVAGDGQQRLRRPADGAAV